jgi:CheY-like chemotaxis protein
MDFTWFSTNDKNGSESHLAHRPLTRQNPRRHSFRNQHLSTMAPPTLAAHLESMGTNSAAILVSVVDDDESVRESLPDLLQEFGLASRAFAAPSEFLQSDFLDATQCLILDISMPEMSGPELRRELLRQGRDIPTIFITAHSEFASQPEMREGVVACLIKPFSETDLLEALKKALKF